jgi:hypothetical protein
MLLILMTSNEIISIKWLLLLLLPRQFVSFSHVRRRNCSFRLAATASQQHCHFIMQFSVKTVSN